MTPPRVPGVLVTGFGPFLSVVDNPAARLAMQVHDPGGRPPVHGLVIPVSYQRGPDLAIAVALRLGVSLVIGLGVATSRQRATVERCASLCIDPQLADVDEVRRDRVDDDSGAPAWVEASLAVDRLAEAMGVDVSEDAGGYVCNAWLYRVSRALEGRAEVGFVHLPPQGLSPEELRQGIAAVLASRSAVG